MLTGLPRWRLPVQKTVRDVGSIPGLGRFPGGGHGNPLQYSCLENPMDRGAWWATVHGVAKSQTRLKQLRVYAIVHWFWPVLDVRTEARLSGGHSLKFLSPPAPPPPAFLLSILFPKRWLSFYLRWRPQQCSELLSASAARSSHPWESWSPSLLACEHASVSSQALDQPLPLLFPSLPVVLEKLPPLQSSAHLSSLCSQSFPLMAPLRTQWSPCPWRSA